MNTDTNVDVHDVVLSIEKQDMKRVYFAYPALACVPNHVEPQYYDLETGSDFNMPHLVKILNPSMPQIYLKYTFGDTRDIWRHLGNLQGI